MSGGFKPKVGVASVLCLSLVLSAVVVLEAPGMASAYTSCSPIYIQGNLDFHAGNGVVGGSGTESDPYIIEGWEIVTTNYGYGIIVANTDKYFTIRNCYVHGVTWDGSHAIYFTGVTHGSVQDCVLTDSHRGIDVRFSTDVGITSCNISGCGYGIYSEASDEVHVSYCQIQGNSIGFSQQASACSNCTFVGNNITWNDTGITAYPALNYSIEGNNVSENSRGIYLADCDECHISGNYFEGNLHGGFWLSSAANTTLTDNVFVDDGLQILGEDLAHWNSQVIGTDNLANGLPIVYLKDSESVVVDGESIGALILANCTGSRVANLSIARSSLPISAGYSDYLLIENSTFTDEYIGIFLKRCSYASVLNNTIVNATLDEHRSYSIENGIGIYANQCPALSVIDNNVVHPDYGIFLMECPDVHIEGNEIAIGTFASGMCGIRSDDALVLSNDVSSKDTGILWWDSRNLTIIGNAVSESFNDAMCLGNITNLNVELNEFVGNGFGPRFDQIFNASINGNLVADTFCSYAPTFDQPCLKLTDSDNIELMDNLATGNENGLYMYDCGHISILGNEFLLGENEGIFLEWCRDFSVSSNNISANGAYGIHLRNCDEVQSVTDNIISDNSVGVYAFQSSPEVVGNVISVNDLGIELVTSWANVHHNDFMANAIQVSVSDSTLSRWNESYPDGGNYWSDYKGNDMLSGPDQDVPGADGFGDTPYFISLDSEDSYPLMRPATTANAEPIAFFTAAPSTGDLTSIYEFNASGSWDREDSTDDLDVRWDWEDDGVWDTEWSKEKSATHEYPIGGLYVVRLEARDSSGLSNETTRTLMVEYLVEVEVTVERSVYAPGELVNFTVSITNLAEETITLVFGDSLVATFSVLDAEEELVYYFSPHVMFVVTYLTIDPLETVSYDFQWNQTRSSSPDGVQVETPGVYTILGSIRHWGERMTDSAEIVIEDGSPATTPVFVGVEGANDWYTSSVNVSFDACDEWSVVDRTEYSVDGGEWSTFSSPFELSEDGIYAIEYFSVDCVGNQEEVRSSQVKIDCTSPSLSISAEDGTVFNSSSVNISFSCSDSCSGIDYIEYRLDNGTFVECESETNIQLSLLDDGAHVLSIRVHDQAGNTVTQNLTFEVSLGTDDDDDTPAGTRSNWVAIGAAIALVASAVVISVFAMRRRARGPPE